MPLVTWSDAAVRDLDGIFKYIAAQNPLAAVRVSKELVVAGDSLALFPRRGRRRAASPERELVSVRPYILVYEITSGDAVRILRVWHAAQDRG